MKVFKDERLPPDYKVHKNDFDEFVVINQFDRVARIIDRQGCVNVRASLTLEGSVENYLQNIRSNGLFEVIH